MRQRFLTTSFTVALLAVALLAHGQQVAAPAATDFPPELVNWRPCDENPLFQGEGSGHWDAKIRERGWILRDGDCFRLWFTGYDGTREGIKLLGYATSSDGLHWTRSPKNPLVHDRWIEDMMVIKHGGAYYMFSEGSESNHAEMLTSKNGIDWKWEGPLGVRLADGQTPAQRPCGTPTIWIEGDTWYLFYEWKDQGVWLARSADPMSRVWINVQDEPVLSPGPADYDKEMIALNQVIKYRGAYYGYYHGSGGGEPRTWNTNVARSTDLIHWKKYPHNPIVADNKSSGIVVPCGDRFRLYTMHDQIDAFSAK
jgi:hypothetical protein